MTSHPADYFRYFAIGPTTLPWGLGLTATGFTLVKPGTAYPPAQHPTDHHFDWEHGRVLDAMQIVLITGGGGWFESKATGRKRVEPGTAFVLLPKIWHRYRPDQDTGWIESWIEVRGPVVDNLVRAKVFSAQKAVRKMPLGANLDFALDAVHLRARAAGAGFNPEFSALALGVLAAWETTRQIQPQRTRIVQAVADAERYFAEHLAESVNVEELARRLGIAYSHFRRTFRAQTGFTPWQYMLNLRLAHARRTMASSDITLDELAARTGFSSGFHFSMAFKQATGVAPNHWRRKFAPRSSPSAGDAPIRREVIRRARREAAREGV